MSDPERRTQPYADFFGGLLSFSLGFWRWLVIFILRRFGIEVFNRPKAENAPQESKDQVR